MSEEFVPVSNFEDRTLTRSINEASLEILEKVLTVFDSGGAGADR